MKKQNIIRKARFEDMTKFKYFLNPDICMYNGRKVRKEIYNLFDNKD